MRKKRIILLSAVLALNDFMMCDDRDGTMPKGTFFSEGQRQRGDKKMKKSIGKTIVSLMIVTAFLMPLMGNTALAEDTETYYFSTHDLTEKWETDYTDMVDGDPDDYASTTIDRDVELLTGNTCPGGQLIPVTTVEIRAKGKYSGNEADIILRPVFGGTVDGEEYTFDVHSDYGWSDWFDITDDDYAPGTWTLEDVKNLECDVKAKRISGDFTLYCSIVEIRVTN